MNMKVTCIRLKRQNERTALGQHKDKKHALEKDDVNEIYKFEVMAKGKDPLDVSLREGILIKKHRPTINHQINNGFIM